MKILLNVAREFLPTLTDWQHVQAIRLQEQPDGSFDLVLSTQLESVKDTAA